MNGRLEASGRLMRWGRWLVALGLIFLPGTMIYWQRSTLGDLRLSLLLMLTGAAAGWVMPNSDSKRTVRCFAGALTAAAWMIVLSQFWRVTNFPFSLTWSEGNHIWASSLFLTAGRYELADPLLIPNYVTPGLYILRGLPLLIPDASLVLVRLWESLLWVWPGVLFGWMLSRRYFPGRPILGWVTTMWAYLFLNQGPVYAPLLLAGAIMLWGMSSERRSWQVIAVFAATLLAGLSRWTWTPAPAAWALLMMGLEAHLGTSDGKQPWPLSNMLAVAITAVAAGVLSQVISAWLTGRPAMMYLNAMEHPLLWYRLAPNATYLAGVIGAAILATRPVILAILWLVAELKGRLEKIDLGLAGSVGGVFLAGGLVVSIKIGGGNNLHNLDIFLATLTVLAVLLFSRSKILDGKGNWVTTGLVSWVLFAPAIWNLYAYQPPSGWPVEAAQQVLADMNSYLQVADEEGEILFIDQRQLLTLGLSPQVPLVSEYEQVEMMDHAMAGDQAYFDRFYGDLAQARFSLIVCDPMYVYWKGSHERFGEENDAWVRFVSQPILNYYQPIARWDDLEIWLMAPIGRLD